MTPGKNHVNAISTEIFKYVRIHPNFASRPVWREKMFLCCFFPKSRKTWQTGLKFSFIPPPPPPPHTHTHTRRPLNCSFPPEKCWIWIHEIWEERTSGLFVKSFLPAFRENNTGTSFHITRVGLRSLGGFWHFQSKWRLRASCPEPFNYLWFSCFVAMRLRRRLGGSHWPFSNEPWNAYGRTRMWRRYRDGDQFCSTRYSGTLCGTAWWSNHTLPDLAPNADMPTSTRWCRRFLTRRYYRWTRLRGWWFRTEAKKRRTPQKRFRALWQRAVPAWTDRAGQRSLDKPVWRDSLCFVPSVSNVVALSGKLWCSWPSWSRTEECCPRLDSSQRLDSSRRCRRVFVAVSASRRSKQRWWRNTPKRPWRCTWSPQRLRGSGIVEGRRPQRNDQRLSQACSTQTRSWKERRRNSKSYTRTRPASSEEIEASRLRRTESRSKKPRCLLRRDWLPDSETASAENGTWRRRGTLPHSLEGSRTSPKPWRKLRRSWSQHAGRRRKGLRPFVLVKNSCWAKCICSMPLSMHQINFGGDFRPDFRSTSVIGRIDQINGVSLGRFRAFGP